MLIQIDKSELGDKRLNEVENLAKLKEGNLALAAKNKIAGQETLENKDMALGQPMSYQDLIRLLGKINPAIQCSDGGVKNAIAVRVPADLEDGTHGLKYVTGFYKEVLPEFSWVSTDEYGRPLRETRGWRTVVLALVKQGVISYRTAVDVFGEPNGQRSGRWHELLRDRK